jgi:tRNA (guanine-N7-)-methyltransferase
VVVGGAVLLDLGDTGVPLRPESLFGRECPLEVEIGVGKGRFLLEWAKANPELGLLGVERISKYLAMTGQRARRAGLSNLRLVHTTAEDLLFRCLAPASVSGFHVYFPDPWPKKRHHKRRFFRPDNVSRLAAVLRPGGLLRVKTDHPVYAELIAALLAAEARFERADPGEAFAGIPETHFEIKYSRVGRSFHRFAARRTEAP